MEQKVAPEIMEKVKKALKDQMNLSLEDIHTARISLEFNDHGSQKLFETEDAISDALKASGHKVLRTIYGGSTTQIFLASSATPEQLETVVKPALPAGVSLNKVEELDTLFFLPPWDIVDAKPKLQP